MFKQYFQTDFLVENKFQQNILHIVLKAGYYNKVREGLHIVLKAGYFNMVREGSLLFFIKVKMN